MSLRLGPALVALTAGLALAAPAAEARVRVSEQRVVVTSDGGRAVIERSPVRISFFDPRGRALLRELANPRSAATPLPLTEDPEPYALERDPDNAVYAPLTYEVGAEAHEQWNAGLFTGNTLFSRRSGTTHFAREAVAARRAGAGARLVVSTSEPGRRLFLSIAPDATGALRVRVTPSSPRGIITMGDSFAATPGEGFHGFGGRHGTVDKRGEKLYGWADQENLGGEATISPGIGLLPLFVEQGSDYTAPDFGAAPTIAELPGGLERYMFPNGANAAYYPQAQFISSRGYGFLLNQSEFSRWRMANDRGDAWQVQASAPRLDYTVAIGPGRRRAISELTKITGRHRLPPAWAQGSTLWRAIQVPALPGLPATESAASYRAKLDADLAEMEARNLWPAAYAFEGWALVGDLAYVRALIDRLHSHGTRVILYHRAYVSDDTLSSQVKGDYEQTINEGLVAKTASGAPYVFGSNGGAPGTLLDFTNPATRRWWKQRLFLTLGLGMDGFMQDFGEQVQDDMRFHSGASGHVMHNRYPVIWHRISRKILDQWERKDPERDPIFFFTRDGYSGRPGSAAYEMGNFPGDETVDWQAASGLRSLAPDMLNRAVGGAVGYTTDIGGYADFLTGPPDEELFNRWSEWSALTPFFRVHNSASTGTKMPWSFGEETFQRWKAMAALHDRAIPLLRSLWRKSRRTGQPITSPMWLAAREAPSFGADQQWMLGANVLVAPVVDQGATTKAVALPRGCWRYAADGARFKGPGSATVPAPLGVLPHFIRCGTFPFKRPAKR